MIVNPTLAPALESPVFADCADHFCQSRRRFLQGVALTIGSIMITPTLASFYSRDRWLYFYNPNTGETVRTVYWTPRDGYLASSLRHISWVLRDHRNDEMKLFDYQLLDQMYFLQSGFNYYQQPFHVICGYRSPSTNALLRRTRRGVAKNSYHMQAKAVDIRMPGRSLADLRNMALSFNAGGVGTYGRANFLHIDSGPVRTW